jgi:putative phage-type endonuclease
VNERAQWLENRRKVIGGTDIAAILGLHPYKSPIDVYLDKLGLVPDTDNDAMKWGRLLEPVIADEYARESGVTLLTPEPVVHPTVPFLGGNPDRLIVEKPGLLEVKTCSPHQAKNWGEPGTDCIPRHYYIQAAWYLAMTGREFADVAVLVAGQEMRTYRLVRDMELEGILLERAVEFWQTHVLPEVTPPVDGSERSSKYLKERFPLDDGSVVVGGEEEESWVSSLLELQTMAKDLESQMLYYSNKVKERLGEASVLQTVLGNVTWKKSKDSPKTDWEAVARYLGADCPNVFESAVASNTIVKDGSRRFILPRNK